MQLYARNVKQISISHIVLKLKTGMIDHNFISKYINN